MLAWELKGLQRHLGRFESTQSVTTQLDPTGTLHSSRISLVQIPILTLFVGQEPLPLLKEAPLSAASC